MMEVLSYGIGTLIAFAIVLVVFFVFISDITQKKHGVLRNYPVVGHLRYFFEQLGEYFRQYFSSGDREEMPFNRATRAWVYRLAKNEGGTIGFGSTYDLHQPGALIFVNHPFPVLEEERLPTPALALGEGYCKEPFVGRSIVNVSGMSYGAISAPAVRSLSRGAAVAGCWLATGEGGSGAVPQALADHMSLSIDEALPRVVDALIETGLKQRVRVVASGKIVTSARAAWALCAGQIGTDLIFLICK